MSVRVACLWVEASPTNRQRRREGVVGAGQWRGSCASTQRGHAVKQAVGSEWAVSERQRGETAKETEKHHVTRRTGKSHTGRGSGVVWGRDTTTCRAGHGEALREIGNDDKASDRERAETEGSSGWEKGNGPHNAIGSVEGVETNQGAEGRVLKGRVGRMDRRGEELVEKDPTALSQTPQKSGVWGWG